MDTVEKAQARKNRILNRIEYEFSRASMMHGRFNSHHEAYAVIKEELDEYWQEVMKKSQHRDVLGMKTELIQIAAMAMRAIYDLIPAEQTG